MIPNEWYAVLEAKRVRDQPVGIKRLGEDLVLFRQPSGEIACLPDRCSHRGSKLSLGRVSQGCLVCPYHGLHFDGGGTCRYVPANGPDRRVPKGLHLSPYTVREQHGLVWLWWGEPRSVYPEIPWFPQPEEDEVAAAQSASIYDLNYVRFIENALDVHHFPFIHGSLTPRVGTLVDPFTAEFDGEVIHVLAGLKRHRDEPDEAATMFDMYFKFPNVFFVRLHQKIKLIQITTPVDDHQTWAYVRYYQSFVRTPRLGRALSWALMTGDKKIAQELQDFPVFRTQTPHKPSLDCGYTFIPADRGIHYFLVERERRIAAAAAAGGKLVSIRQAD